MIEIRIPLEKNVEYLNSAQSESHRSPAVADGKEIIRSAGQQREREGERNGVVFIVMSIQSNFWVNKYTKVLYF